MFYAERVVIIQKMSGFWRFIKFLNIFYLMYVECAESTNLVDSSIKQ